MMFSFAISADLYWTLHFFLEVENKKTMENKKIINSKLYCSHSYAITQQRNPFTPKSDPMN